MGNVGNVVAAVVGNVAPGGSVIYGNGVILLSLQNPLNLAISDRIGHKYNFQQKSAKFISNLIDQTIRIIAVSSTYIPFEMIFCLTNKTRCEITKYSNN